MSSLVILFEFILDNLMKQLFILQMTFLRKICMLVAWSL